MAAVIDRVDGGRQLHEGVGLHKGEHPSGRDGGGSSARYRLLSSNTRSSTGYSTRAPASSRFGCRRGCDAWPPCAAAAAANRAGCGGAAAGCSARLRAAAGCSVRLPSAAAATKGAQADAGSGGSLGGGRLRLRCRGMRPRLTRWLPTIVSIHCYVQGCAWCLSRIRRTPTLWGRW
jgi:hypothetical protein